jgi:hypothetical protein
MLPNDRADLLVAFILDILAINFNNLLVLSETSLFGGRVRLNRANNGAVIQANTKAFEIGLNL